MADDEPFRDYYDILQVNPACDAKMLEAAYHYLAKIHHPDQSGSNDSTKFYELTEAYRVLRDPKQRADYDRVHAANRKEGADYPSIDDIETEESTAGNDAEDHIKILTFLYNKRRENAQDAGVIGFYIQELLGCSHDHFEFHKWYLKEKGYIQTTGDGTLAITITGIDHLISVAKTEKAEKLYLGRVQPMDGKATDSD